MANSASSGLKTYHTYIVRIWLEEDTNQLRLVLLDTVTGERWVFTHLQGLSDHLQQRIRRGI